MSSQNFDSDTESELDPVEIEHIAEEIQKVTTERLNIDEYLGLAFEQRPAGFYIYIFLFIYNLF